MQENKTAWIVAVVVILVAAAVAWWYVAGTGSEVASPSQNNEVATPATVSSLPQTVAPSAPAADSTDQIQKDLDGADSGASNLQGDLDALDGDIQKGF